MEGGKRRGERRRTIGERFGQAVRNRQARRSAADDDEIIAVAELVDLSLDLGVWVRRSVREGVDSGEDAEKKYREPPHLVPKVENAHATSRQIDNSGDIHHPPPPILPPDKPMGTFIYPSGLRKVHTQTVSLTG